MEHRVRYESATVQMWGEPPVVDNTAPLVVLRLLGARGRAELATQDPADRLQEVRSITWAVNPPGFGASSGPVAITAYVRSILAAYDFVVERHPSAKVWVYGKSIGATGALYVAAHRKPAAVILKNVIDVPRVTERQTRRWLPGWMSVRLASCAPLELDALQLARQAHCPALFVTSRHDQLASPESQEAVLRAYAGPARVLHVEEIMTRRHWRPSTSRHTPALYGNSGARNPGQPYREPLTARAHLACS